MNKNEEDAKRRTRVEFLLVKAPQELQDYVAYLRKQVAHLSARVAKEQESFQNLLGKDK